MLSDYDVLLQPVFQEMRRLGVDVSLEEYLQAIQMLHNGIGLEDIQVLTEFCRLLWAKSREEQEIFDAAFAEKAVPKLATFAAQPDPRSVNLAHGTISLKKEMQEFPQSEKEASPAPIPVKPSYGTPLPTPSPKPALVSIPTKRVYNFTPRLPLSKSEMGGHWRQLRHMRRTGPITELDIEATIHDICQYGLLRKPFMQPRASNTAQLLLLIDQDGSMTPFKMLVKALVESVTHNSLAGKTALYYFHDCPGHTLYEDNLLGQPITLEQVFDDYAYNSHVLIVSDAGAARAHYDDERVRNTKHFLQMLRRHTYLYAWINPVPRARWHFTTAEDIERFVPMYPLDREGLDDAIQILRGHPFSPKVSLS
jgi:uncharacterized protein with von Willebrand factor type A (vWA) domain